MTSVMVAVIVLAGIAMVYIQGYHSIWRRYRSLMQGLKAVHDGQAVLVLGVADDKFYVDFSRQP